MTPTLSMLVEREAEIRDFKPEAFFNVEISAGGVTLACDKFSKKQKAEKFLQEDDGTDQ